MIFDDLVFKKRENPSDFIWSTIGLSCGTSKAVGIFDNGYGVSIIKDSYLANVDDNTYELGIIKDNNILFIEDNKDIHNFILNLEIKHDGSDCLVYGFVTKENINKIMDYLENYKEK
jgi:hypothetical protein